MTIKKSYVLISLVISILIMVGIMRFFNKDSTHDLYEKTGVTFSGRIFSWEKKKGAFPDNWAIISSTPPKLPKDAKGSRGLTDIFNQDINEKFGHKVVSGVNDSECYSYTRSNFLINVTSVLYKDKYYSFIECGSIDQKHLPQLPPMPDDSSSSPMS